MKKAPTCQQAGEQICACVECGMIKTETIESTGHDFSSGDTCANEGCGAIKPTDPEITPPEESTEPGENQ